MLRVCGVFFGYHGTTENVVMLLTQNTTSLPLEDALFILNDINVRFEYIGSELVSLTYCILLKKILSIDEVLALSLGLFISGLSRVNISHCMF